MKTSRTRSLSSFRLGLLPFATAQNTEPCRYVQSTLLIRFYTPLELAQITLMGKQVYVVANQFVTNRFFNSLILHWFVYDTVVGPILFPLFYLSYITIEDSILSVTVGCLYSDIGVVGYLVKISCDLNFVSYLFVV